MKGMLLSAGLGQRLRPLTFHLPKPAIPVLGRPMALENLNRLARHGIGEVVMNLHHLPDTMKTLVGEETGTGMPTVHFSFEEIILGTGGGMRRAASLLRGEGPILIHNCDFLSDIDLEAAARTHRDSGQLATLVLAERRDGYSVVDVDADGNILSLAGEPEADPLRVDGSHLFTGCHIIDEDVLDLIPEGRPSGIVSDVYRGLAAEGRLGSYIHDGFWWEFGTPEQYLDGSLRLLDLPIERRLEITEHDLVREIAGGTASLGAGATVLDGARVDGRAALGFASLVGRDAVVKDSVIMPEAWVGPGSRLDRVIVCPRVEVPAGFECGNALVCGGPAPDGDLPPRVRRHEDLLIYDFESSS